MLLDQLLHVMRQRAAVGIEAHAGQGAQGRELVGLQVAGRAG